MVSSAAPVRILTSEHAGRFIVASRKIEPGELLLSSLPDAAVPLETCVVRVCATCFSESKTQLPIVCNNCGYAAYCSAVCQGAAANVHEDECHLLKRLADYSPRRDIGVGLTHFRLALRIVCARRRVRTWGSDLVHASEALCSGAFSEREDWQDRLRRYMATWSAFEQCCGEAFVLTKDDFAMLLCTLECNYFHVWNKSRRKKLGVALYVDASLFNHSCKPNVARVQRGLEADFHALEHVAEGEALCIAYVDPRLQKSVRSAELSSRYAFVCTCIRCTDEVAAPAMCPWHLGYLIPDGELAWCSTCGKPFTSSKCERLSNNGYVKSNSNISLGLSQLSMRSGLRTISADDRLVVNTKTAIAIIRHPLSYRARKVPNNQNKLICRYHNFRREGCGNIETCPHDHDHCYWCGNRGHLALLCSDPCANEAT